MEASMMETVLHGIVGTADDETDLESLKFLNHGLDFIKSKGIHISNAKVLLDSLSSRFHKVNHECFLEIIKVIPALLQHNKQDTILPQLPANPSQNGEDDEKIMKTLQLIQVLENDYLLSENGVFNPDFLSFFIKRNPNAVTFIPVIVIISKNLTLVLEIWKKLLLDGIQSDEENTILAAYFLTDYFVHTKEMLQIDDEWLLLLEGISGKNERVAKYSARILRLVINQLNEEDKRFKMEFGIRGFWYSNHAWWMEYLDVLEALKQPQAHLVIPSLKRISPLEETILLSPWTETLRQISTQHDNKTVKISALASLFESASQAFFFVPAALNDISLYAKDGPICGISVAFNRWLKKICQNQDHLDVFLLKISEMALVPMFHTLDRLRALLTPESTVHISIVKHILDQIATAHNAAIREGVRRLCLEIVCKFAPSRNFVPFILTLDEDSLRYIRCCHATDVVGKCEAFVSKCMRDKIVLAAITRDKSLDNYTHKLVKPLSGMDRTPYIDREKLDQNLDLVALSHYLCPMKIVNSSLFSYIEAFLQFAIVENEMERVNFYIARLRDFKMLLEERDAVRFLEFFKTFVESDDDDNDDDGVSSCEVYASFVQKYATVKLWAFLWESFEIHQDWMKLYVELTKVTRIRNIKRYFPHGDANRLDDYRISFWKIARHLYYPDRNPRYAIFFAEILNVLDVCGKEELPSYFEAVEYLMNADVANPCYEALVDWNKNAWIRMEECRQTPLYSAVFKHWLSMTFRCMSFVRVNLRNDSYPRNLFLEFSTKKLSFSLLKFSEDGGISNNHCTLIMEKMLTVRHLLKFYINDLEVDEGIFMLKWAANLLIDAFCQLHVKRKDHRIEREIIARISDLDSSAVKINALEEIRTYVLKIILTASELLPHIIKCIMLSEEESTDGKKSRCMRNSLTHRSKHRKLQLLMLCLDLFYAHSRPTGQQITIFRFLDEEKMVYHWAVKYLGKESNPTSVRYMLEWLIVIIILQDTVSLVPRFWEDFEEARNVRVCSICSFICIAFHLSRVLDDEKFTEKTVETIIPWLLDQHLNIRLYSMVVLPKLLNSNEKLVRKYEFLTNALESVAMSGNVEKNFAKINGDFYFNGFHPILHFNLRTILWDFPRLTDLTKDDWISSDWIERVLGVEMDNQQLPRGTHFLSDFQSTWDMKKEETENDEVENSTDAQLLLQRKFDPKRDRDVELDSFAIKDENAPPKSGLIVVASLMDKAANLGGLTRTCEVFGIRQLVLRNLSVLKDKDFLSLSMTAEKHVPLLEVKSNDLPVFLKALKNEGNYAIVGAEQTGQSECLKRFKFQFNTVLVLGNEKEGIPPSILPLLDFCVEIPQFGNIRSLNVHVSASLFIWEYTKQQRALKIKK